MVLEMVMVRHVFLAPLWGLDKGCYPVIIKHTSMKIAQALLLRKQLAQKEEQLRPLKMNGDNGAYQMKVERISISDQVDEARVAIPKMTVEDVTKEYNKVATALRKIDAAIQEANWKFEVDFKESENPIK